MKKDLTKLNLDEFNETLISIAKERLGYRQKLIMLSHLINPLLKLTEHEKQP